MDMVKKIYGAKRSVVIWNAARITAIRCGDARLAARYTYQIQQLKTEILREFKIILD